MTPFYLRIFVADSDADGFRLIERSNWIGKYERQTLGSA